MGTPGTVPRPSLLALSAGADLQPSMAPPAATVVVASERPMAAPRRRGRPQTRSLGVVVTLGHPLGTPKLYTGPSGAREASSASSSHLELNGPIGCGRLCRNRDLGPKKNPARRGELPRSTYQPSAPAPAPPARSLLAFFASPVTLWVDFDAPSPPPPARWYWARSWSSADGGARSEPPPMARRRAVARAARPCTFLASSVPKYRWQQI